MESSKRLKLSHSSFIPSTKMLGSMQKSTSTNNLVVQGDSSNAEESLTDTYSISSSSPIDDVSIRSQEDFNQPDEIFGNLLKKPRVKGVGPDTDEENMYFRTDSSSSDDNLITRALPSQSSSPCLLPTKSISDNFETGVRKQITYPISSNTRTESKMTKRKIKYNMTSASNSLVDYKVSASSQSSSSSSSSSEDSHHGHLMLEKCASQSKIKLPSGATDLRQLISGRKRRNDGTVSSPVNAKQSIYYDAASVQIRRYRLNYDNAKKEISTITTRNVQTYKSSTISTSTPSSCDEDSQHQDCCNSSDFKKLTAGRKRRNDGTVSSPVNAKKSIHYDAASRRTSRDNAKKEISTITSRNVQTYKSSTISSSSYDEDSEHHDCCNSSDFKKLRSTVSSPVNAAQAIFNAAASRRSISYRLNYDNAKKEISPITTRNTQTYNRSSIPLYDVDEIFNSKSGGSRFIDSHCHLDFLFRKLNFNGTMSQYRRRNQETFPKSYEGCLAVFCDPETFTKKKTWDYLLEDSDVWGAFGCHPKMSNGYDDYVEKHLLAALQNKNVVALGEIGLDYSAGNFSDVDVQKRVYRRQLKLAVDNQLPLVIHCRDANSDSLRILKEIVPHDHHVHLHCFTGTWKEAMEWLDPFPNLYIGLTPLVTFPSARQVHETARNIPLNRLLLETDAPYFVPKPLQVGGKRQHSHPGMAIHVAAQVAILRYNTTSLNDVLTAARENTKKMYGI